MKLNYNVFVPKRAKKGGVYVDLIREFLKSSEQVCEVSPDEGEVEDSLYIATCLRNAARRTGGCRISIRDGRVYLIRLPKEGT